MPLERASRLKTPACSQPIKLAILPGDIITTIDGVEIVNMRAFINAIASNTLGAQVRAKVIHDGRIWAESNAVPPKLTPNVRSKRS
jgi:S1-C subfamily serine protease